MNFNEYVVNVDREDEQLMIDLSVEEQRLSQQLNQLSTSVVTNDPKTACPQQLSTTTTTTTTLGQKRPSLTPTTPTTTMTSTVTKKLKTGSEAEEKEEKETKFQDKMPKYLSATNTLFEHKIHALVEQQTTSSSSSSLHIEQLRQIAFYLHQLAEIELNLSLWTTYLHSGTGQMTSSSSSSSHSSSHPRDSRTLTLWPEEVKTSMINHQYTKFNSKESDDETYLRYVYLTNRRNDPTIC